ncbi:MAG: galactose-1-phosphate uridylyltransferase, partial [Candidatus Latescibacteria bacterium 4484_7]
MPEIRQDPATKEWVIIATDRAKRPEDFARTEKKKKLPRHSSRCPFCPGNESKTPGEIYSNRDGNGNWTLRVVPNKFPALVSDGSPLREEKLDFFRRVSGIGDHEVIIESPYHNDSFGEIDDDKAFEIVAAYHLRYRELSRDKRLKLVKIFRNHGVEAGTSLEHPHSQIVATPVVPLHIRHQLEEATRFYDNHGECVFCRLIDMELKVKSRVVTKEHGFLVIEPFASRMPFETWVIPLEHHATFGEIDAMELKG